MNWGDTRLPQQFWRRVVPVPLAGCWLWTGRTSNGYGNSVILGEREYSHRRVVLVEREIPAGMHVDHLCRVILCCNPAHLEVVTPSVNARRGIGAPAIRSAQTHCVNGHPFDADNTYIRRDRNGGRECRACFKARRSLTLLSQHDR